MSTNLLRLSNTLTPSLLTRAIPSVRTFSSSRFLAAKVDSHFLSQITAAEKKITNSDEPAKGGPTAKAQAHVGKELNSQVIRDITEGEKTITGSEEPAKGGPTAVAQSLLTSTSTSTSNSPSSTAPVTSSAKSTDSYTGTLDSVTLARITEAEKELSGQDRPVKGGPTAKAQSHVGESITSEVLSDITAGEKKITGGERIKGGPTATAQSELAKSRE